MTTSKQRSSYFTITAVFATVLQTTAITYSFRSVQIGMFEPVKAELEDLLVSCHLQQELSFCCSANKECWRCPWIRLQWFTVEFEYDAQRDFLIFPTGTRSADSALLQHTRLAPQSPDGQVPTMVSCSVSIILLFLFIQLTRNPNNHSHSCCSAVIERNRKRPISDNLTEPYTHVVENNEHEQEELRQKNANQNDHELKDGGKRTDYDTRRVRNPYEQSQARCRQAVESHEHELEKISQTIKIKRDNLREDEGRMADRDIHGGRDPHKHSLERHPAESQHMFAVQQDHNQTYQNNYQSHAETQTTDTGECQNVGTLETGSSSPHRSTQCTHARFEHSKATLRLEKNTAEKQPKETKEKTVGTHFCLPPLKPSQSSKSTQNRDSFREVQQTKEEALKNFSPYRKFPQRKHAKPAHLLEHEDEIYSLARLGSISPGVSGRVFDVYMCADGADGRMQNEFARYASFSNYTPPEGVWMSQLAKAGFYCPQEGSTRLRCAFCPVMIDSKEFIGKSPMEVHQRLSPGCPLVIGRGSGNLPVNQFYQTRGQGYLESLNRQPPLHGLSDDTRNTKEYSATTRRLPSPVTESTTYPRPPQNLEAPSTAAQYQLPPPGQHHTRHTTSRKKCF
ncbi:hypothetical protein BaRGS_00017412 [Batillaria attramentaria]|uniref:Uncharacterized protein n=1 Tax=Batillaria attramentaria TaxID=370345 RepID=A0ABD0KW60_9CAEN